MVLNIKQLIIIDSSQTKALTTLWGITLYLQMKYDFDKIVLYKNKYFTINGNILPILTMFSSCICLIQDLNIIKNFRYSS